MIDVSTAELIVNSISFLSAYIFVVTIAGAFRAWVAVRMGDVSVEREGFVTLNPLVHVHPLGVLFLFLRSFGGGSIIPINPDYIQGRYRWLKLACAFYSDTILHGLSAIFGLVILILAFDTNIIGIVEWIIRNRDASHMYMAYYYPTYSSGAIVAGYIVAAAVSLHIGLMVLEFLFNSCMVIISLVVGPASFSMYDMALYELMAWVVLMMFFFRPLLRLVAAIITYLGYTLAYALHFIH
jgi:hypothetical protein